VRADGLTVIIDTHFHAFPPAYIERLPSQAASTQGKAFRRFEAAGYLEVMDRYGIDLGVFSNQAAPIEQQGVRSLSIDLAKALNDSFIEATVAHPTRFRAFARLPMIDIEDALRELERCRGERSIVGVVSPTNVAGRYLDEPAFAPFWEALEAAGLPLFLHPTYSPSHANWDLYSLKHKVLWPVDTTLALSRIVSSGTLDRYPSVSIIAAHLGGPALLYLDRLAWPEGGVVSDHAPEHYFRHRIYYDIAGPSRAAAIAFAAATVGAGRLLFGADFPHGRGGRDDEFYPLALGAMEAVDLEPADKDRIYFRNAQSLLGLG
jgi:predicted TIM-barrel fold metal-dependent hydrolase